MMSLLPVGQLQIAVRVDRRDVAGMEPAVRLDRSRGRLRVLVIGADDPRPAHQQFADRPAVMRQLAAGIVDDLHLDAEQRAALLGADRELRLRIERGVLGLQHRRRADRAHLGHAPALA